jgi:hypothetical protein
LVICAYVSGLDVAVAVEKEIEVDETEQGDWSGLAR